MIQPGSSETQLWQAYKSGDRDAANALAAKLLPRLRYQARGLLGSRKGIGCIDEDDLVSEGNEFLASALDTFNGQGNFGVYVLSRTRYRMIDALRQGLLNQPAVQFQRRLSNASTRFFQERGYKPSDEELASLLGISTETFYSTLASVNSRSRIPLDEAGELEAKSLEERDIWQDIEHSPLLEGLTRIEKETAVLYAQDFTLAQIAQQMGRTESAICKRVKKIREAIQQRLPQA